MTPHTRSIMSWPRVSTRSELRSSIPNSSNSFSGSDTVPNGKKPTGIFCGRSRLQARPCWIILGFVQEDEALSVYIVISSDMSDEHHFLSIDRARCDCPDETNLYVRRVRVRGEGRKTFGWGTNHGTFSSTLHSSRTSSKEGPVHK